MTIIIYITNITLSINVAASGFPPLGNIHYCCLIIESGPCFSPCVAGHTFIPTTDLRLGAPLQLQLTNLNKATLNGD